MENGLQSDTSIYHFLAETRMLRRNKYKRSENSLPERASMINEHYSMNIKDSYLFSWTAQSPTKAKRKRDLFSLYFLPQKSIKTVHKRKHRKSFCIVDFAAIRWMRRRSLLYSDTAPSFRSYRAFSLFVLSAGFTYQTGWSPGERRTVPSSKCFFLCTHNVLILAFRWDCCERQFAERKKR